MAARFGATPVHQYAAKIRWIVGCLLALNALLIVAVVIIAANDEVQGSQGGSGPLPSTIRADGVELLVTATRVEEGSRLDKVALESRVVPEENVPIGALRARDRQQLAGKFAARMISPNVPLVAEDVTSSRPLSSLHIPPGFRAVTIIVDPRTAVDGFAKPDARVDVLFTFTQNGRQKVATLVNFTKILSINGLTGTDAHSASVKTGTTATLLVNEKDAKRIELARSLGALSLVLVGEVEDVNAANDPGSPIDIDDLIRSPAASAPKANTIEMEGKAYFRDSQSGEQIQFVLPRGGKWRPGERRALVE